MNADAEFREWIRPNLTLDLHVRDLVGQASARATAVCRTAATLSEIVKILVQCPGARNVYVVDDHERPQGQVSLSALSEVLHFDYQPSRPYPQKLIPAIPAIPAITAKTAADVMEPVDVAVREDESLDGVLRKLVPTREEEFPVVDNEGRVIGCLTVVDILGRVVSNDE